MGRYRAPQQPGSHYITPQGHARLSEELKYLWRVKRPEVTRKVAEAAAQGDRSENAEYIYGKKQLREIDRRVRYLQKRLDHLVIVDRLPDNREQVFFGAWVRVEDSQGRQHQYRIVGPDEFDLHSDWISMDSPLARALMRKSVDDEVSVQLPKGIETFTIIDVHYESPDDSTNA